MLRSDGGYVRDYLYVRDAAAAYLTLADAVGRDGVAGGAFNFSDERPLTVLELVGKIAERMETQTLEPIVLGSAVGEIREQVLSAEKARTVLGWRAARSRERPRRDDRLVQGPPRRRRSGAMTEHAGADGRRAARADPRARERVPRPGVRSTRVRAGQTLYQSRAASSTRTSCSTSSMPRWTSGSPPAATRSSSSSSSRVPRRAARAPVQLGLLGELLAVSALTSKKLGERRLRPGDEVITVAAGFPTTVNRSS